MNEAVPTNMGNRVYGAALDAERGIYWEGGLWWRPCCLCGESTGHAFRTGAHQAYTTGRKCASCSRKPENNPRFGKTGEDAPFYGKTHTDDTKRLLSRQDKSYAQTDEFRETMRQVMESRVKAGEVRLSNYEYVLLSHGKEEADRRDLQARLRKSEASSGHRNPQYGKPSPQGSGNGWSGWMNDRFFRSLGELNFMIMNPGYVSAETSEWKASYEFMGVIRNTWPDFVNHDELHVVECKPKKLQETPRVIARAAATLGLCQARGYRFEMVDPGKPESTTIEELVNDGILRWTERYERKWHEWKACNL